MDNFVSARDRQAEKRQNEIADLWEYHVTLSYGGKEYIAEAHKAPPGMDGGGDWWCIDQGNERVYHSEHPDRDLGWDHPVVKKIEERIRSLYERRHAKLFVRKTII